MEKRIVFVFVLFVNSINGHPYAQVVPFRTLVSPYQYQSLATPYAYQPQSSLRFQQPLQPSCSCQQSGSCPNCNQEGDFNPSQLTIDDFGMPQRAIRSVRNVEIPDIGRSVEIPVMENAPKGTSGSPPSANPKGTPFPDSAEDEEVAVGQPGLPRRVGRSVVGTVIPIIDNVQILGSSVGPSEENDSSFAKAVRSTLPAIEALFSTGGELQFVSDRKSAPRNIPTINLGPMMPTSDTRMKKPYAGNVSPIQGSGMYYSNVQIQAFNSNPDELDEKINRRAVIERESKERRTEEQQRQVMDTLEQLLQGQAATLIAQLDAEMMAEQEFSKLESYLREMKHQLNSMRTAVESRDKPMNDDEAQSLVPNTERIMSDSQMETTTPIGDIPDTASAVPTTSTESTTSAEKVSSRR